MGSSKDSDVEETTGPSISRVQSMPTKPSSWFRHSSFSNESGSPGTGRRRSATGWLKSIGNRLSNERGSQDRQRANSVGNGPRAHDETVELSRTRTQPQSRPRQRSGETHGGDYVNMDRESHQETESPCSLYEPKKHVGFSSEVFAVDPPQRIPPIRPDKGNVEFLDNGELRHRTRSRPGVPVIPPYLAKNHVEASESAIERAKESADRLRSSLRRPTLFGGVGKASKEAPIDEELPTSHLPQGDVDQIRSAPARDHGLNAFQETEEELSRSDDQVFLAASGPRPDLVYTRCCHLREIMPIKNILRQLQGQEAPIPHLRVANTRPTLVEIQAFSDFLTAVPVVSLQLDYHILTDEMISLLIKGLSRSKVISRLSFVSTKLSTYGFATLCSFLAWNTSLLSLDLSCYPSERVPIFNRRELPWPLLNEALIKQGGVLEDLGLNGTRIPSDHLIDILNNGFRRGKGLEVGNNGLGPSEIRHIVDWLEAPESECLGLSLEGNDLSKCWNMIGELMSNNSLYRLILRNTNLNKENQGLASAITPEMAATSALRHLDLSGNPALFPMLLDRLATNLPKYPYLARFRLDNCKLGSAAVVALSEALSHCHQLVSVSLLGNERLNEAAAAALCVAVHLSGSLCTVEVDGKHWPEALQLRLSTSCLRNLERRADEAQESMLLDVRQIQHHIRSGQQVTRAELDAVQQLRAQVRQRMQDMLARRRLGPLSQTDRETMIRLYFYDGSLERLHRSISELLGIPLAKTKELSLEEATERMPEGEIRPSNNRVSSQSSLLSLKKLEREEGKAHMRNAGLLPDQHGRLMGVKDLEKVIS